MSCELQWIVKIPKYWMMLLWINTFGTQGEMG